MDRYTALALQTRCDAVNKLSKDEARAAMAATIDRIDEQIRGSFVIIGPSLKLVVLPEYFMTGYPVGDTIDGWADKAAIEPNGQEMEALGAVAQKHNIYLAGNVYETDPNFPGYYFQACFVVSPSGERILSYRRLISMFAPTPHDVLDHYLEIYGDDALFPVADTEIGRLACCASEEILFPEICRAHAIRGAEVILHPTSEISSPQLTVKEITRRARAVENLVYVISANTAGVYGEGIPAESVDGMSKIVNFTGQVVAEADTGESIAAHGSVDIAALRAHRQKPGMSNYFARQRLELFSSIYADTNFYPANTASPDTIPQRDDFIGNQRTTIQRLMKKGLI